MLTVLVVEDDALVLRFCHLVLTNIDGFEVLKAENGTAALDVSDHHHGAIDLLLSDIAMPDGPNGIELAEILRNCRPQMRVLLMSGCDYEACVLSKGWQFISKPFLPAALVSKIELVLEHPLHQRQRTTSLAS